MNNNYSDLNKATDNVDPRKQLKPSQFVTFEGLEKDGLRVLFVGNSITLHDVLKEIGWNNSWGMAASAKEKDYVHLCYSHIQKAHPQASFCICQVAMWERDYKNGETLLPQFQGARDYDADVIITKVCGNTQPDDYVEDLYFEEFRKLLTFLNKSGNAKIILCTEFFNHPTRDAYFKFAKDNNYPICDLTDLGYHDDMKAIGLFEHEGVAAHPGDLGMKTIADRICKLFDELNI